VSDLGLRCVSAFGLVAMIAIAWAFSLDRKRMPWRTVLWGLGLQLAVAVLLLLTGAGTLVFGAATAMVHGLESFTAVGSKFVFGPLYAESGFAIVTHVLPVIVFLGALFSMLFHVGIVQRVIAALAMVLARTLRTSGAESLCAAATIFVGMVEAPLLVRPYIERMTRSELFTVMATGMSTIAGSVMVIYAGMLGEGYAGHLLTASLLAAPAGILLSKVMLPETETPLTADAHGALVEDDAANLIDAASAGAIAGLRLAGYVGAMLIAFVALIAMANAALGAVGGWFGAPDLTFQRLLGYAFAPLALLIGVPAAEVTKVGSLLGVKTVLNEFIAYQELAKLIADGAISLRAGVLASYALCGFANFGSLAILLGGLGGLAPSRRGDVAQLGVRSIAVGTLATLMAACWAGILL
jgi:concentrative nucleoside transporter, CNT family